MDSMSVTSSTKNLGNAFQLPSPDLSRLGKVMEAGDKPTSQKQKELMKAAQDFEGIFVQQVLEAMDKTIDRDESGFLSGGSAEDYFRSMLNEEISKTISHGNKGFGLAETVYRQMSRNLTSSES
jgi:Rod binding domain-containing protein